MQVSVETGWSMRHGMGERERGGTLACRRRLLALGLVGGVEDHAVVQRVARLLVAQHSAAAAGAPLRRLLVRAPFIDAFVIAQRGRDALGA